MLGRIGVYLDMVKVAHTLFALPFALIGAFLAAGGIPPGKTLFYIVLAMIGGRSAAMGFNRVVDAEIDAKNPRTKDRAIPAGQVSKPMGGGVIFLSGPLSGLVGPQLPPPS